MTGWLFQRPPRAVGDHRVAAPDPVVRLDVVHAREGRSMGDRDGYGAEVVRTVVSVPGPDLDVASAEELRVQLSSVAACGSAGTVVVVDLSAVVFMDCAGMTPLLEAKVRFGRHLVLRGVRPRVARLLDMTETGPHFDVREPAVPAQRGALSPRAFS